MRDAFEIGKREAGERPLASDAAKRQAATKSTTTRARDEAGGVAAVEEGLHRPPARARRMSTVMSLTHIPTKRSAIAGIHAPREGHRVLEGFLAVGQRVAHGLAHEAA